MLPKAMSPHRAEHSPFLHITARPAPLAVTGSLLSSGLCQVRPLHTCSFSHPTLPSEVGRMIDPISQMGKLKLMDIK